MATHTHSGPAVLGASFGCGGNTAVCGPTSEEDLAAVGEYTQWLLPRLCDVALRALLALEPCALSAGSAARQ